jgi:hypothetical protein
MTYYRTILNESVMCEIKGLTYVVRWFGCSAFHMAKFWDFLGP